MNTQQEQQARKTVVFDENGQTIEEQEAPIEEPVEIEAAAPEAEAAEEQEQEQVAPQGKYRVGNKVFATQEEALSFATTQLSNFENEQQIADAYRQGMREALSQAPQGEESVTPEAQAAPQFDTEELYTNTPAFLQKFAQQIKEETKAELSKQDSLKEQSNQIWRELTDAHPQLADFRPEVEDFVQKNTLEVRALINTKGRPAAYSWIAMKMKSRFEAYANALKPKRQLSNAQNSASPSSKAERVTPKEAPKKTLSFAEQLRSIRSKAR